SVSRAGPAPSARLTEPWHKTCSPDPLPTTSEAHAPGRLRDGRVTMSLRVSQLTKDYPTRSGPLPVLRGVDLELDRGSALAVMGPSGSGKSTLLYILGTLDAPTTGKVELDTADPFALPERDLAAFRNRHIGFVFQDHHLLPQCSVLENVLVPTLVG